MTTPHTRILLMLCLGGALPACKSAPPTQEQPLAQDACATATQGSPDALAAIAHWITLDAKAQELAEPARALRATFSTLYMARAWRVDQAHWMAIISDSPEPAADAPVILLSVSRAVDGSWAIDMPAQLTDATILWPQL